MIVNVRSGTVVKIASRGVTPAELAAAVAARVPTTAEVSSAVNSATTTTTMANADVFAIRVAADGLLKRITLSNFLNNVIGTLTVTASNVRDLINARASKSTPADTDFFTSADGTTLYKNPWSGILAAIWTRLGGLIAGGTGKSALVDGDSFALSDSEAAGASKKTTLANLKTVLKTHFDTFYGVTAARVASSILGTTPKVTPVNADQFAIIDSVGSVLSRLSLSNFITHYINPIYQTRAEVPAAVRSATGDIDLTGHPGWYREGFSSELGASQAALTDTPVFVAGRGKRIRTTNEERKIVNRRMFSVNNGEIIDCEIVVQRVNDTDDPSGNAIQPAIAWFTDEDRDTVVGTTILSTDLYDIHTGSGVQTVRKVVSFTSGADIDFAPPAGAVVGQLYVQLYGADTVDDVEVLRWRDITAVAASPDLTSALARITALESINPGELINALELKALGEWEIDTSSTADADPGPGILRGNNATWSLATVLRFDILDKDAIDRSARLDSMDDSTNPIKGELLIVQVGDPTKWLRLNVTAVDSSSGYRNVTVAVTEFSAASPFADGVTVRVFYEPLGNAGIFAEIASEAETRAFANNTKGLTPLRLKQGLEEYFRDRIWFDITESAYGAVADYSEISGTGTDNTTPIANAMNAAEATGVPCIVYAPPGQEDPANPNVALKYFTGIIRVPNNVLFVLHDGAILKANASVTTTTNWITNKTWTGSGGRLANDLGIIGGQLDGSLIPFGRYLQNKVTGAAITDPESDHYDAALFPNGTVDNPANVADRDAVCLPQSRPTPGALTINGALASGGTATMAAGDTQNPCRRITIYSATGDNTGVTFTFTCTNVADEVYQFTMNGPAAGQTTSLITGISRTLLQQAVNQCPKTVTLITTSGATNGQIEVGIASTASTSGGIDVVVASRRRNLDAIFDLGAAVTFNKVTRPVFRDVELYGHLGIGFVQAGCIDGVFKENFIHDQGRDDGANYAVLIASYLTPGATGFSDEENTTVQGNIIRDVQRIGLVVYATKDGALVADNYIENCKEGGIYASAGRANENGGWMTIRNNTVRGLRIAEITPKAFHIGGNPRIICQDNHIDDCDGAGYDVTDCIDVRVSGGSMRNCGVLTGNYPYTPYAERFAFSRGTAKLAGTAFPASRRSYFEIGSHGTVADRVVVKDIFISDDTVSKPTAIFYPFQSTLTVMDDFSIGEIHRDAGALTIPFMDTTTNPWD